MTEIATLAEVRSLHPQWECWQGTSQLFYARRRDEPRTLVRGESPEDLNDMINRAEQLGDWGALLLRESRVVGGSAPFCSLPHLCM